MADCVASLTVLSQYNLIKGDYPSKDRYSALSGRLGNVALSTLKGSNLKLYQSHLDALFNQYGSLPGLEKQRDYAQYINQKLNCENIK